jgi:hypothetical protein
LPNIVIEGQNAVEETIVVSTSTIFRQMRDTIPATDLKADDFVVVIGEPNQNGQIEAKLVRVVPAPGQMDSGTKSQTDAAKGNVTSAAGRPVPTLPSH